MKSYLSSLRVYLVTSVLVFACIELLAFAAVQFVLLPREPSFFFRRPLISRSDFERYMDIRDPLLGWPARNVGTREVDTVASRPIPSFPIPGEECVSLYGDSFTYGDEVSDADAWSNVLSLKMGCRVANYGVGGYGTDQAYLRFAKNSTDGAKIIILGIFPDNVLRNINQYRYFLDARTIFSLKPRFILDQERLKLIEIPKWSYEEFVQATERPQLAFPHETFLPDSSYGPVSLTFPYSIQMIKLLRSERVWSAISGSTSWEVFYRSRHETRALDITAEITKLFVSKCKEKGQKPLIIIYPTGRSFKRFKRDGVLAIQPLIEELNMKGIHYFDLHSEFVGQVDEASFCKLLTQPGACVGHFNAAGNSMVADAVLRHINEVGMLN